MYNLSFFFGQHTKNLTKYINMATKVQNGCTIYQNGTTKSQWPRNIQNLTPTPKCTEIDIFDLKIYHLATSPTSCRTGNDERSHERDYVIQLPWITGH
jgi:hypothetical protein